MLKKIIISSALLAATSAIALADNPAPYVGAGIGINTVTYSGNQQGSFRGVPFNLFVGYGGVINQNFYLAGELGATLGTAQINRNSGYLKPTYGYGASLIPGFMLSDHTLAFARLGVVNTRFSNTNMQVGAQAGLGLQTSLTQNLDVRGEYDFTAYKSVSNNSFNGTPRSDAFNLGLVYKFD